jgi:hypothetical protein
MGSCQAIHGLVIDSKSAKALQNIKQKVGLGNALASVMSIGVFSNIFTRSNVVQATYNISQTDWGLYAQSIKSIPSITRKSMLIEMEVMITYYQLHYDHKLLNFWLDLHDGCSSL